MNFYSIDELCIKFNNILEELNNGKEVIITNNGKPSAIMIKIPNGNLDKMIQVIRQVKATIALNNMRLKASQDGFKSDKEIESLINEARSNI